MKIFVLLSNKSRKYVDDVSKLWLLEKLLVLKNLKFQKSQIWHNLNSKISKNVLYTTNLVKNNQILKFLMKKWFKNALNFVIFYPRVLFSLLQKRNSKFGNLTSKFIPKNTFLINSTNFAPFFSKNQVKSTQNQRKTTFDFLPFWVNAPHGRTSKFLEKPKNAKNRRNSAFSRIFRRFSRKFFKWNVCNLQIL